MFRSMNDKPSCCVYTIANIIAAIILFLSKYSVIAIAVHFCTALCSHGVRLFGIIRTAYFMCVHYIGPDRVFACIFVNVLTL